MAQRTDPPVAICRVVFAFRTIPPAEKEPPVLVWGIQRGFRSYDSGETSPLDQRKLILEIGSGVQEKEKIRDERREGGKSSKKQ